MTLEEWAKRARAVLRDVEWEAGGSEYAECPKCGGDRPAHEVGCELAALLQEEERRQCLFCSRPLHATAAKHQKYCTAGGRNCRAEKEKRRVSELMKARRARAK